MIQVKWRIRQNLEELEKWVKENPGKFTYPAPPDFTGSAFIRHMLNETSEEYSAYLDRFDEELLKMMQIKFGKP